ncbi:FAD-dependent monooxygenase [Corallococcus sp. bb12-1]|uniref:FAD-dependent monooxygenase n=1 Tax=Corallococcus sp. bb12-1 TaxID=2996784 RepID=UPI0022717A4B|nr:FAD-dependent monooxygenase [Corallococcus sp. bb12-1]MCY1042301.1 FAD-dependent monooxygenase [Corallococcus sp. bb12-1]
MAEVLDVAVVGGGPTGLMLACELALAGVRVQMFERRAEPVRESRALTLHPRSLEVLALRGLEGRFLERGRPLPTGHFAMLDTRLDFSVLDTRFPYTLFIPQAVTEALLEARARELGVAVHRGHTVEVLRQDVEGVELEGTSEAGAFRVRARFVVGADGARSAVRRLAGIAFPGTDVTRTAVLGDVTLAAPPSQPAIGITNTRGGVMVVPMAPGVHRIVVNDPLREQVPLREPVTLDELRESVTRIAGTDFGMKEPRWLSRFGNETRLAERYRDGRVLLAGDAAHIHFPAGGQGLNVGLQDAMNLGWKLAAVVKDGAPDVLLDSYQGERRPVGDALIRNTLAQTALIGATQETLALRTLMSDLLRAPKLNREFADSISALDVGYAALDVPSPQVDTPLLPEWSGRRLGDLELRGEDGTDVPLYSALHPGRWLLLGLGDDSRALPRWEPGWPSNVTHLRARAPAGRDELQNVGGMLVRPDGHVGWAWAA